MIEDGKLWFIGGGTRTRAVARQECVTKEEAMELARTKHKKGGHFHRDLIKIALLDRIHSPGLDESIVKAISDCARCKNFGGTHLHALLQPITRRHPFELLVGDYLSMPPGKGGYHTIGLYLDTFTQHIWGYKFKTAGTGKTTVKSLEDIYGGFAPAEVFMSDGGKHFKNNEVRQCCERWGGRHHVVATYSPCINGLVEGTNRILLYVLACLCAPEVGEDGWQTMDWKDLPRTWPDHFDDAIRILNWRILPALKFRPKEILLGLVVNTKSTPIEASSSLLAPADINTHMAYAVQQRLDGYSEAVKHAVSRKAAFDRKVMKKGGVTTFKRGQLVQTYRNDLANTLSTARKLQPMWTGPYRVVERMLNSYKLETLDGKPLEGDLNARRLRRFIPREGTELAEEQTEFEARLANDDENLPIGDQTEEVHLGEIETEEAGAEEAEVEENRINPLDKDQPDNETEVESGEEDEDMGSIGSRIAQRRRGCDPNKRGPDGIG